MNEEMLSSPETLLAWINTRLDVISGLQHDLAYEKALLQEQATRLRLGTSVEEALVVLRRGGVTMRSARPVWGKEATVVEAA